MQSEAVLNSFFEQACFTEEINEKLKAKTKSYRRDLLFSLISKINTLEKPFFIFIALNAFKKASHLTPKCSNSTKCSENM